MVTLQETAVKFNNNLHVSHTGGRLSSDSGLLLVDELMDAFHFEGLIKQHISFKENRQYWTHTNQKILKQMILQLIAGYKADSSADILRHDPVLQTLSLEDALASQPSISRFFDRITEQTIEDFQMFNQALIDQARLVRNDTDIIIDLDSTHSDTFGRQEQTDYNAHYRTHGYHPLVAFDGLTGDFLKAKLRSGNQYTSTGVKAFLEPLLEHYNRAIPTTDILVRGDSGFATPDIYELCEAYNNDYVIRLKSNRNLTRLAEELVFYDDNHPWDEKEIYYYSVQYQAASWFKPRRVCIRSTREVGELLFKHPLLSRISQKTSQLKECLKPTINAVPWKTTLKKPGTASSLIKQIVPDSLKTRPA